MGHHHTLTDAELRKLQSYDGLDFDYVDNTAHRVFQWQKSRKVRMVNMVSRWLATFFIGVAAAVVAWSSHVVIGGIYDGKFFLIQEYVKTPFGPVKSFFAFMSINLAIAVCGSLVVVFWGVRHTEPLSPFSTHSHSHPHSRILSECLRQCARWC